MIKKNIYTICALSIFLLIARPVVAVESLSLGGKEFVYQISSNGGHSFVPAEQKTNPQWEEKITLIYAGNVTNEEELQSLAIKLRDSYQQKGRLLKALKIDPTENESSKFLLVAVMSGGDAAEAILARVNLENSSGSVLVYAHRFYGEERGGNVVGWFEKNGFRMEKEILEFQSVPSESVFLR